MVGFGGAWWGGGGGGFEVDPRSVAKESFLIKAGQETKHLDPGVSPPLGTKCALPKEVAVAELHKGRKLDLLGIV